MGGGHLEDPPAAAGSYTAASSAGGTYTAAAPAGDSHLPAPSLVTALPSTAHLQVTPQFGGSGGQQHSVAASGQASTDNSSGICASIYGVAATPGQQQLRWPVVVAEVDAYTEQYNMVHMAFACTSGVQGVSGGRRIWC